MIDEMCDHKWIVYSTAVADGCLMLYCEKCDTTATVDNPTKDEWAAAFYAPSNPYRWDGAYHRVKACIDGGGDV